MISLFTIIFFFSILKKFRCLPREARKGQVCNDLWESDPSLPFTLVSKVAYVNIDPKLLRYAFLERQNRIPTPSSKSISFNDKMWHGTPPDVCCNKIQTSVPIYPTLRASTLQLP